MPSFENASLDGQERALLEAAYGADPALAEELELIDGLLEPGARERFWHAFARECARCERPAAAVLPALEWAALGYNSGSDQ